MSGLYVASNVPALGAQFQMQSNMGDLTTTMNRLSTGLRINNAKDDPAGLIASELLKSDMTATSKAISNTQRANGMINVATSALGQVTSLLNDIRGLVVESSNTGALSNEMIAANQLQIDASLDSIDRIARTTNYLGKKLLDGSMDYLLSGLAGNSQLSDMNITSANLGLATSLDVNIKVSNTADNARLYVNGSAVSETTVVQIGGSKGAEAFTFGVGSTTTEMARAIAAVADATGVTARVEGLASRGSFTLSSAGMNNDIIITSKEVGKQFGNYTFRIVENVLSAPDSAKIVSSSSNDRPGEVLISLAAAKTSTMKNVGGGLFNATLYAPLSTTAALGIHFKMGANAGVELSDTLSPLQVDTSGVIGDVTTVITAGKVEADDGINAANKLEVSHLLNGWTVKAVDAGSNGVNEVTDHFADFNTKTIYIEGQNADESEQTAALKAAIEEVVRASGVKEDSAVTITTAITTAPMVTDDFFKFEGAKPKDLLTVTYTSGMTAQQVSDMVNKSGLAQLSLDNANNAHQILGITQHNELTIVKPATSDYETKYTAAELATFLSSQLGSVFDFELASNDVVGNGGGGRVSFMDASIIYGDVNAGNAIQFMGTKGAPAVRLVNNGAANQKLSAIVADANEADNARGITGKILKVTLATDAIGNSITTAKDIVDFFNTLTAQQTLGVSATLILPDGVDPNGRVWGTTITGNQTLDVNKVKAGDGLVYATGRQEAGVLVEHDMIFHSNNQGFVNDNPYANIMNKTVAGAAGVGTNFAVVKDLDGTNSYGNGFVNADSTTIAGLTIKTSGTNANTSALNDISIAFTSKASQAGFSVASKTLTVYIDEDTADAAYEANVAGGASVNATKLAEVTKLVNAAIKDNWQEIRTVNRATENAGEVTVTIAAETSEDASFAFTRILEYGMDKLTIGYGLDNALANTDGVKGNAAGTKGAAAVIIEAVRAGTDYSNVKIKFELDAGISADFASYDATDRTLTITHASTLTAKELLEIINDDITISGLFQARLATGKDIIDTLALTLTDTATAGGWYQGNAAVPGNGENPNGVKMTGGTDDNQRLVLESLVMGSAQDIRVSVIQGRFGTVDGTGAVASFTKGKDMLATINGMSTKAAGNKLTLNSTMLQMSLVVDNSAIYNPNQTTSFAINGGGAIFQTGPQVISMQQVVAGIRSVSTVNLGGASGALWQLRTGEAADMTTNTKLADRIVNEAISAVTNLSGRLGALQRSTLDPAIASLQDNFVALSDAEASISNADFAEESSKMARQQILVQTSARALSQLNQLPQYAQMLMG